MSRDEYLAGFANYRACMVERGYVVAVFNDTGTIIDMGIPSEAVESGADELCYRSEFMRVNEAWQIANQDELADNGLLEACLSERGLAVPERRQEKVDALLEAEVDLGSCLSENSAQHE